jgi:hypothetical protein
MAIVLTHPDAYVPASREQPFMLGFIALIGFQLTLLYPAGRLPRRRGPERVIKCN